MGQVDSSKLLMTLFNSLPEMAPGGEDVSAVYVNRAADTEHDAVANLRQLIEWSPTSNGSYLFSGLRGSGKTTELNRLISELRQTGTNAFYADASAYLNLNDPDLTLAELLMASLAGLSDAVRNEFGRDFLQDTIWNRTKRLLKSDVNFKPTFKAGAGGAEFEVEATLTENPDFKKQLIEFTERSSEFYQEARTFANEVAQLVRTRTGRDKIVLVVDSLERLSAPTGDEGVLFNSLKSIFFNEPARLRFDSFSVVYSAPPYLHAILPGVGSGFTQCIALPNFKVINRPTSQGVAPQRNPAGVAKMVDILNQRFADWGSALNQNVVEHLAWMSGGNVRRYFSLIRGVARKAALSKAELPIELPDAAPVRHAVVEAAQPLQWLTATDYEWLERFMNSSNNAAEHIDKLEADLPSIIRLFDHSLVLDYQNGSVWYQVPQIVREHVQQRS